jgi:hypothetical protein
MEEKELKHPKSVSPTGSKMISFHKIIVNGVKLTDINIFRTVMEPTRFNTMIARPTCVYYIASKVQVLHLSSTDIAAETDNIFCEADGSLFYVIGIDDVDPQDRFMMLQSVLSFIKRYIQAFGTNNSYWGGR